MACSENWFYIPVAQRTAVIAKSDASLKLKRSSNATAPAYQTPHTRKPEQVINYYAAGQREPNCGMSMDPVWQDGEVEDLPSVTEFIALERAQRTAYFAPKKPKKGIPVEEHHLTEAGRISSECALHDRKEDELPASCRRAAENLSHPDVSITHHLGFHDDHCTDVRCNELHSILPDVELIATAGCTKDRFPRPVTKKPMKLGETDGHTVQVYSTTKRRGWVRQDARLILARVQDYLMKTLKDIHGNFILDESGETVIRPDWVCSLAVVNAAWSSIAYYPTSIVRDRRDGNSTQERKFEPMLTEAQVLTIVGKESKADRYEFVNRQPALTLSIGGLPTARQHRTHKTGHMDYVSPSPSLRIAVGRNQQTRRCHGGC
jgi:hypothetical protein